MKRLLIFLFGLFFGSGAAACPLSFGSALAVSSRGPADQIQHVSTLQYCKLLQYYFRFFIEYREFSEPELVGTAPKYFVSAEIVDPEFHLWLGSRFLPGPGSRFLAESKADGGSFGLPYGRKIRSVFYQPRLGGSPYVAPVGVLAAPGLFFLEGYGRPGLFFGDRRGLFAFHPESGLGVVALREEVVIEDTLLRLQGDILSEEGSVHGFLKLTAGRERGRVQSSFGLERQREWDYYDFESKTVYPNRVNRSGQVSFWSRYGNALLFESAVQHRGQDGMTALSLQFAPAITSVGQLAFVWRDYLHSDFNPARSSFGGERAVGFGPVFDNGRLFVSLLCEQRAEASVESVQMLWRHGDWDLRLRAIFRNQGRVSSGHSFLFLGSGGRGELGAKFYKSERGVFQVSLRYDFFYFQLWSGMGEEGVSSFANLRVLFSF